MGFFDYLNIEFAQAISIHVFPDNITIDILPI